MNIFPVFLCLCLFKLSSGIITPLPRIKRNYGQKIDDDLLHRIKPTSVYTCAQVCLSMKVCKYFNFIMEQQLCELHFGGLPIPAKDSEFYVNASNIPWEYARDCAWHSCSDEQICYGQRNLKQECFDLHIDCGMPDPIPNAEMVVSGTMFKNSTTYICSNDTVILPIECHVEECINKSLRWKDENRMYCLPNRKWEGTPIHCIECFEDPHMMLPEIRKTLTGRICKAWSSSNDFKTATFYNGTAKDSENFCRSPISGQKASNNRPYLWCLTNDPSVLFDVCSIPRCYTHGVGPFPKQIPGLPKHMFKHSQYFADVPVSRFMCIYPNSTELVSHCPISRYENGQWSAANLSCSDDDCYELGKDYTGRMACTVTGRTCQYWNTQTPHTHSHVFPDPEDQNSNFCRQPDGNDKVPWCFTTDPNVRYEHCWIPECNKT